MKILKIILIGIFTITVFFIFHYFLLFILTKLNSPYITLKDGTKKRVMNTENLYLSVFISITITAIILKLCFKRLKTFIKW